ncbi:hypothetical protein [Citrobacter koseri]|uniref:hypothetical protein n=1 Tax=Citrobacter koseri TaxID=545 RepID=UPI003891C6E1
MMFKFLISLAVFIGFSFLGASFSGCVDGWASPSIGHRGACSHHGGVSSIPNFFIAIGLIAAFLTYFKLSSWVKRIKNDENVSSVNNKCSENGRITHSTSDAIKAIDTILEPNELVVSIIKLDTNKGKPQINIFCYSNGKILCEIQKNTKSEHYSKKLNSEQLDSLISSLVNIINNDNEDKTADSGYVLYDFSFYSNNAKEKKSKWLYSLNNSNAIIVKYKLIESFPVLSNIL